MRAIGWWMIAQSSERRSWADEQAESSSERGPRGGGGSNASSRVVEHKPPTQTPTREGRRERATESVGRSSSEESGAMDVSWPKSCLCRVMVV